MKSYRFVNVFLGVLLALAIGGSALGAETIVGEVIDQGCFLRQGARGADHQECAARCLRNGNPAGVLTDEGEVYTLATSAAAFEGFAAKRIRVAGKRVDRSIFPESMQVWENESWVDVPLTNSDRPKRSSPFTASVEKFLEGVKDKPRRNLVKTNLIVSVMTAAFVATSCAPSPLPT